MSTYLPWAARLAEEVIARGDLVPLQELPVDEALAVLDLVATLQTKNPTARRAA